MDFIQTYGPYLLVGLLFLFMMRRGGCCGGHGRHSNQNEKGDKNNTKKAIIKGWRQGDAGQ